LIIIGIKTFLEEQRISRKETSFLGFLPSLGSISSMKGGKINESVYFLSQKDYGILTKHLKNLYRRLRTRINDDDAWEWFGVDTGSNYVQRSGEMFREATFAAANPRVVSKMISENIRKIKNLRVKKLTIANTSIALFGGITFGISFSIYVSLVIGQHMNDVLLNTGDPTEGVEGVSNLGIGTILSYVSPELYENAFLIIFLVLLIHCFLLALTIKTIRGSHIYITFFYFVPFVWVVAITSILVKTAIGGLLQI
jgi:flagellar protein FlaJ